jgi:hypothetical protein
MESPRVAEQTVGDKTERQAEHEGASATNHQSSLAVGMIDSILSL